MVGIKGKYSAALPLKNENLKILLNIAKKSTLKHFTEIPILLNFENLSVTLCPGL